jgi:S-(hydroxymethyl)glutathione dehydrogenase/alcohol dehydrogenase
MDYAIVAENRLTRIPGAMPLREAALLGCAVPTGGGIVWNTAKIQPGQAIAVFGAGGVGLSAIMAAKAMNAGMIMAIDLFDHKLEYAKRMGATHTIHGLREKPVETIRALTGGRGVDYAVEAAGTRETMEAAFQSVCDKGGLCILAGNLPRGEGITLDPFDLIMGKKIIGTWGGESRPDQDIPLWADQYLLGKLPLREMITHTYRLEDINQALEDLEKGRVGRALIDLGNRHEDFHRDRDREGRR